MNISLFSQEGEEESIVESHCVRWLLRPLDENTFEENLKPRFCKALSQSFAFQNAMEEKSCVAHS